MKIALLGYGRMGQEIEKIAIERGHEIVLKADEKGFSNEEISKADVAIDFSVPESAYSNITKTIENGVPVISGTTGWLDKYSDIVSLCEDKKWCFYICFKF